MASSLISTPSEVHISLTGRCNLRCHYCFYANEMTALTDLPTEKWLTFFDELGRLGVMNLTLTGGEVFTRPDFFELLDGIIKNRMRYSILSNGTLIDEDTLAKFEIGKRRLRLNSIQVSIDGSTAEIHDRSRPHSFDRAVRGLRLLKKAGYPVTVRITINKRNLLDMDNIARLLLEDIGIDIISTNDAMPVGAGCQNEEEVALSSVEQTQAIEIMERLTERYPGRLNAMAGPQAKLKMYDEMEHAKKTGEKTTRWGMGHLTACGCIFSRLDVLHDGTIVPCSMLPALTMGNITTDSITEIWHNHPTLQAMRDRRSIPMQQVPGCEECEWAPYCNGSCPGLAHQLTGELNMANPHDCYSKFLFENQMAEMATVDA